MMNHKKELLRSLWVELAENGLRVRGARSCLVRRFRLPEKPIPMNYGVYLL